MTKPAITPTGWYTDPARRHRYWDGRDWTATVSDTGVTSTDPLGPGPPPAPPTAPDVAPEAGTDIARDVPVEVALPPPPPPPPAPSPPARRRHSGRRLVWVLAVALAVIGAGGLVVAHLSANSIHKTYASDYAALGTRDARPAADALDAQVARVKAAYDAYVAAMTTVRTRHEAVTDGFNAAATPLNADDRLGILKARQALPGLIAAYQASLAQERATAAVYNAQLQRLKAMRGR